MNVSLVIRLKQLHLRSVRGNYVRTEVVRLPNGKEQEVTVFSGDNCFFLGQCTMLKTIIIHEVAFSDKRLLNYIVSHELAHKKQWWSFFIIPLALFVSLEAPSFIVLSLTAIGQTVTTHDLYYLKDFPLGMVVAASLMAIPCIFSWLMELDADFQSIGEIGFQTFLDLKNGLLKPVNHNFSLKYIINFVTHPPTGLTVRLWRWLHREDRDAIYMTRT